MSTSPLKIYYLFSVFDRVFRDVSVTLKERWLASQFSGMAYAKRPVLTDPIFESITYVSDWAPAAAVDIQFLSDIEQRYDVTISEMMHADRHIMRLPVSQRLPLTEWLLRQFLNGIQTTQSTLIIAGSLADFLSFFAYKYAEKEGIKFVYPVMARMGGNVFLSTSLTTGPNQFPELLKAKRAQFETHPELRQPVDEFITSYIKAKEQPSYVKKSAGMLFRTWTPNDLKDFWQLICHFVHDRKGFHHNISPLQAPINRILKIIRANRYWKMMRRIAVTPDQLTPGKYLVYPIHFHPEASTLIQGRHFNDQVRIVEMVSKALPADLTLVVKEHKVNIGRSPLSFYRRFAAFHNVAFVSENTDVYALIDKSIGIVTISSSMGLETMMMGKPVLAFGDVFYTVSKNVIRAQDLTQMRAYIHEMRTHHFDEIDRAALFGTMMDHFVKMGRMNPTHEDYPSSIQAFVDALVQFGYLGWGNGR